MTPAINLLQKKAIIHRVHSYQHDSDVDSYGDEAVKALGISGLQVFKTLVVELNTSELAVAVVPVGTQLNLKAVAKACHAKKAVMAKPIQVERASGYVLGGVSPLGQKKSLKTLIDESAQEFSTIYVSAGRRGLEIELSPSDLASLSRAKFARIQA